MDRLRVPMNYGKFGEAGEPPTGDDLYWFRKPKKLAQPSLPATAPDRGAGSAAPPAGSATASPPLVAKPDESGGKVVAKDEGAEDEEEKGAGSSFPGPYDPRSVYGVPAGHNPKAAKKRSGAGSAAPPRTR